MNELERMRGNTFTERGVDERRRKDVQYVLYLSHKGPLTGTTISRQIPVIVFFFRHCVILTTVIINLINVAKNENNIECKSYLEIKVLFILCNKIF